MTSWAYDWAIFTMGVGALALVLWFARKRTRARQKGTGLRVVELGMFVAAAGWLLGVSSLVQDLGGVRWWLMASGFLLGLLLGSAASRRQTGKWELALRAEGELGPRPEKWWQSGWLFLVLMGFGVVVAVVPSKLTGALFNNLRALLSAPSYLLSGFFVASGQSIALWARQKERETSTPLRFPIRGW